MDSSSIEALCRRAEKAWTEARHHHSALREGYRWTNPKQWLAMTQGQTVGIGPNSTNTAYDHIFDPTGCQALRDGANQIAEALHPWDQEWVRWGARPDLPEEAQDAIAELAQEHTELSTSLLTSSNFDAEAPASHMDFMFGTGFLLMTIDDRQPTRLAFTAVPAWQWGLEADPSGRIQAAFRKVVCRARDLAVTVPKATWPEELRKKSKDQPDAPVELWMAVYYVPAEPRLEKPWMTVWYSKEGHHLLWAQESRTPPVIIYRARRIAGQAWGDGPGFEALPDIKVANKVVEMILRNAAYATAGVWQADDDGVLNPNTIRLVPGAIIPKAMGSAGLTPLEFPGQFDVSQIVLNDLRTNIRRAFYVTRIEEREMTAEEYRGRLMQQLRDQRGTYGQLRSEFVTPLMLRTLDLAVEMGRVQASIFDGLAQVELTGPLAMDVRGAEVERVKQAMMDVASILGPDMAIAAIKPDKLVPFIQQQRAANKNLFRTEEEMQALGDRITELIAQQMAMQQAGAAPAAPPGAM